VRDLLDIARTKPGTISYGSAGIGSASFLSAELFKALAQVDITHIPYRGTGPALIDLIAGRIQVQFENAPAALPQIRSGELKAIAVGTAKRSVIIPDLPAIAETLPGYEASSWLGLLAPTGTPRPIIDKLNAAINRSLTDATIRKRLSDLGVEWVGGSSEEFGAYLKAKVEETDRIAKAAGLVHLVNAMLGLLPAVAGAPVTLERMLGIAMAPVCWLMGIPWGEAATAGALMGIKTILNEFVAYLQLAALPAHALSDRSRLIMLYALCGFANFGSLGILIGGLATMAPERRDDVVSLGFKSIVSGTLSTCLIGAIVGVLT
jgi:hypothetical protein